MDLGNVSVCIGKLQLEAGEPAHRAEPHKSLWWKYYAPWSDTLYLSSANGPSPAPSTTRAIYEGSSLQDLKLLAKGEGGISAPVQAGHLYYIALAAPVAEERFLFFTGSGPHAFSQMSEPDNLVSWKDEAWNFTEGAQMVLPDRIEMPPSSTASQSLAVEPNRQYSVGFSYKSVEYARVRLSWEGAEIATLEGSDVQPTEWRWTNYTFRVTGNTAALLIENLEGPATLGLITIKAAEGTVPQSQRIDFATTNRLEFGAPP